MRTGPAPRRVRFAGLRQARTAPGGIAPGYDTGTGRPAGGRFRPRAERPGENVRSRLGSRPASTRSTGLADASGMLAGVVLDAAFGDPRRWHPVAGFGRAAAALERRLYAPNRAAGLRYAVPAEAGGSWHDFTGAVDGDRIDHILVTRSWKVVEAAVSHYRPGGRLPSDHWPVVATLEFG